jgi:hypothetical protein
MNMNDIESVGEGKVMFYYGASFVIRSLLIKTVMIPSQPASYKTRRDNYLQGDHFIKTTDGRRIPMYIYTLPMGGLRITCAQEDLQVVYKTLRTEEKLLRKKNTKKDLSTPVLPKEIHDTLDDTVFGFLDAIHNLGTTKGFGNTGLLFSGPPGTGKSETMRWIAKQAWERYRQECVTLGYSNLQKNLADGNPIASDSTLLIFIDDIDANLLRDRKKTHNPLTSQFLTCLDGVHKFEGRVIIATTNECIDDVDPALLRPGRFDKIVKFNYPSDELIAAYCKQHEIDVLIDPALFTGWSFARIDMFMSRYRVANYRFGTSLNGFYEKFIYENGTADSTVTACEDYSSENTWE